jgi:short-subunit dehydrogenase
MTSTDHSATKMNFFDGKNILITGATSGIGRALAESIASQGTTLLLVARNQAMLQEVKKSCESKGAKVLVFNVDLSEMNEVNELATSIFSSVQHIDILINNAGISQRSLTTETIEAVDRQIMELNFFSPVKLTKLLWPLLVKSKHANIVNISSLIGTFGFPQRSAYAASKHAMEGFFESWMLENKEKHIHFTTIAPGRIFTNISFSALKSDGSPYQTLDEGQARGIRADVCAAKIIKAIKTDRRKMYILQQEHILLFFYRFFPSIFVYLIKKLGLK